MTTYKPAPGLRIGHIHLHVSDISRSVAFYRDVLGFDVLFQTPEISFLSVDGYHHHIGLNNWGTNGKQPDGIRRPGLYHFALNYPTQKDLARAVAHVLASGHRIDGAGDHYSHLAVYISDPDGNGIELAWDRDASFWLPYLGNDPDRLWEFNKSLDVASLIAELEPEIA